MKGTTHITFIISYDVHDYHTINILEDTLEVRRKMSPQPMFHSPLVDTLVNGPLYDSYCIEMKMFNAINQSGNTSKAAMVRMYLLKILLCIIETIKC